MVERHSRPHAIVLVLVLAAIGSASCARPVPTPTASATTTLQPTTEPTSEPVLRVDGIAAAVFFRELHPKPGVVTPGDNLEAGSRVYLVAGPVQVDRVDWWQLHSDTNAFGWMPAVERGTATLVPIDPACPDDGAVTVDQIVGMGSLRSLACFGAKPLSFDAVVICLSGTIDGGPGGTSWMDSYRWCHTVGTPGIGLYGETITSTLGADLTAGPKVARFRITGHFDDPEARGCWNLPVGVSLDSPGQPEPGAVMACREKFVVTAAKPLD